MFKDYPDVVTVEQMSEMLDISTKTAYKLLNENCIKHFKIGRIFKIPKYNILIYLGLVDTQEKITLYCHFMPLCYNKHAS